VEKGHSNITFKYKNLGDENKTAITYYRLINQYQIINSGTIIHMGDRTFFKIKLLKKTSQNLQPIEI